MPKMPDLLSVNAQRPMQSNFGVERIARRTKIIGRVLRHCDVFGVQSNNEEVR